MIEYRKNNFFTLTGTGNTFDIKLDPITRPVKSYCEELISNAKEIWDKKDGTLYCLYSGGIDSEIMLAIFSYLNIDIIPVIVKILPNLNNHDMEYAFEYCKNNNLNPLIIDIDLKKFVESNEFVDIAKLAETGTYQYLTTMKAAMSLNGIVLCGNEEPYLTPNLDEGKWYYMEKESWGGWRNLYKKGILKGTSAFHSWTSETLLSFMLDPVIVELGNNRLQGKLGSFSSRIHVYERMFPMIPRTKYTGWENIEKSELFNHNNIKEVLALKNIYNGEFRIEYNELVKKLNGNYNS